MPETPEQTRLFRCSAAGALLLHAWLLFGESALAGGADLTPHLRLIERMGEAPALRSVYPPGYHALGALLAPWLGVAGFAKTGGSSCRTETHLLKTAH